MIKRLWPFVVASALCVVAFFGATAQASVDNLRIINYQIDYTLGRDVDNRSNLKTVERVTAVFPNFDQNHGFERIIPSSYKGHSLSLKITSVTDENGRSLKYSTSEDQSATVLRIGDAKKYVHGKQTYVITYIQRDVTAHFADADVDEFYWDTSGTDLRVPIDRLTVSVTLHETLLSSVKKYQCYTGVYGAHNKCELQNNGAKYTATATKLPAGGNITIAIGFNPGTFASYQPSLSEVILLWWIIIQIVLAPIVIALIVWLVVHYIRVCNRTSEQNPIAPEYIPPASASVSIVSSLLPSNAAFSAQLIDLAVRHYIKIIETKPKSTFSSAQYEIEVIKPIDDLRSEEREILTDLFGTSTIEVGARFAMKSMSNNISLSRRLLDNPKKLRDLIRDTYKLRQKDNSKSPWFYAFASITLVFAILLLSPTLLVLAIVVYALAKNIWVLTDEGLALVRYAKGLKMYIKVAEVDRLKMLQSPRGAEKSGIDSNDQGQVVRLYERVLPYAVLFGLEKQWNTELGRYYEDSGQSPDWYSSASGSAFNAVVFSSAISSFSSSANSYASYSSSSSSSGSSGGGFSGGGGGGGGGGGW